MVKGRDKEMSLEESIDISEEILKGHCLMAQNKLRKEAKMYVIEAKSAYKYNGIF